ERERVWPLRDAAGAVVAEHVRVDRPGGKRMWWRRPDGRRGLGGLRTSDLPLYGSERLADVDAAALVVVAEGEHATDALLARGIVPAVGTVTGASGTPTDDVLRVLTGRDVVLWTDADDPGRAHMQRIAARLAALGIAARVSTGAPMHGETRRRSPAGVVIVTAEDGLADTIRPRLYASGADLTRCLAARPDESPSLDADGLVWLRRACARVGAALVILDPLVAMMPGAVDAHRDQDIRRMLRPIRALAEELNVAILAIRHLRKAAASSPTDAGGGSVGIGAAARVVMLAAGDPGNAGRHVLA